MAKTPTPNSDHLPCDPLTDPDCPGYKADNAHSNGRQTAILLADYREFSPDAVPTQDLCTNCGFNTTRNECDRFRFGFFPPATCNDYIVRSEGPQFGNNVPAMSSAQMIAINTSHIREETRQGRKYWVIPFVGAQEQVMNGRLVLAENLEASLHTLNGRPIVAPHPRGDTTANSPDIASIGQVFNARMDGKRLVGEAWFDIAKLKTLGVMGQQILNALKSGVVIETSLGWFQDVVQEEGTHEGDAYHEIPVNIHHDHLAVLLDDTGACSISDGCGIAVNEEKESMGKPVGDIVLDDEQLLGGELEAALSNSVINNVIKAIRGVLNKRPDSNESYEEENHMAKNDEGTPDPVVNAGDGNVASAQLDAIMAKLESVESSVEKRMGKIEAVLNAQRKDESTQMKDELVTAGLPKSAVDTMEFSVLKETHTAMVVNKKIEQAHVMLPGGGYLAPVSNGAEWVDAEVPSG